MEQPKPLVVLGLVLIGLVGVLMLYPALPDKVHGLVSGTGTVAFSIHDEPVFEYTDEAGIRTRITIHRYILVVEKVTLVASDGTEYVVWSRTELDLTRENVNKTRIPHCTWITHVVIILTRIEFNATFTKDLDGDGVFDERPCPFGFRCDNTTGHVQRFHLEEFSEWEEWARQHYEEAMEKWEQIYSHHTTWPPQASSSLTINVPPIPPEGLRIEIDVHFHVGRGDYYVLDWDLGIPKPEGWELPTNVTITKS